MKIIAFCFLLFLSSACLAKNPSLQQLRNLYEQAPISEKSCKELLHILKPYNVESAPLMVGYRACAKMVMAKYLLNPISKWNYFSNGRNALSNAIQVDSSIVELRFLRFTVQSSAPYFLGYHEEIDNDKVLLLNSIEYIKDINLKDWIIQFLKQSRFVSNNEKKLLPS